VAGSGKADSRIVRHKSSGTICAAAQRGAAIACGSKASKRSGSLRCYGKSVDAIWYRAQGNSGDATLGTPTGVYSASMRAVQPLSVQANCRPCNEVWWLCGIGQEGCECREGQEWQNQVPAFFSSRQV